MSKGLGPKVHEISITAMDRTFLVTHLGFWPMGQREGFNFRRGDHVRFIYLDENIASGIIWKVEDKGKCVDEKFEYFRDQVKIWFKPYGLAKGLKPNLKADWAGISPITRVHSVPNNWRVACQLKSFAQRVKKNRNLQTTAQH